MWLRPTGSYTGDALCKGTSHAELSEFQTHGHPGSLPETYIPVFRVANGGPYTNIKISPAYKDPTFTTRSEFASPSKSFDTVTFRVG